jgi:curli production assembly/transport component CsgF
MKNLKIIVTFILLSVPCLLFSQNIVYKPMNPFFGGDTFNYQQLLAEANAQNDFKEPTTNNFSQSTDLQNFTDGLNRQLLNSLSQDLFQQQFGDQGLGEGTFVFGSLVVDVSPATGGLLINILDTKTGEQTQITIPN